MEIGTKFVQAAFVQLTGAYGLLFTDKVDGGTYVALSTLALAVYATAQVREKANELRASGGDP